MAEKEKKEAGEAAQPVRLGFVGPMGTGKTALANNLCGVRVQPSDSYQPTVAARALECDIHGVPVEVWDVSGDEKYSPAWSAVAASLQASIHALSFRHCLLSLLRRDWSLLSQAADQTPLLNWSAGTSALGRFVRG
jgi:GTPase SAR1 family protein